MLVKKYMIVWHTQNDNKLFPRNEMHHSSPFCTLEGAKSELNHLIDVDRDRHESDGKYPEHFVCIDLGEDMKMTTGNGQVKYYNILEFHIDDTASEIVAGVKKMLEDKSRNYADKGHAALEYIVANENKWMHLRSWAVDIRFSPAACVHHVMAADGVEAENIVNDMIDARTLNLTTEQKAEMLDNLFENVEAVEVVGPDDEE